MKTTYQTLKAKENLTKNETLAKRMIEMSYSDTIGAVDEDEFDCDVSIVAERVQIGYGMRDAIVVRTQYCECTDMLIVPYTWNYERLDTDRILHIISDRHSLEGRIFVSDVYVTENENTFDIEYADRINTYTVFDTYFE